MAKLLYLIGLVLLASIAGMAQHPSTANKQSEWASDAEELIRTAYKKLEIYNRAAELNNMRGVASKVRDDSVLKFSLKNFHSGAIAEIKPLHISEVVTLSEGDVVQVSSGRHTLNNGPPEAFYRATWSKKQKDSGGQDWTIEQLFQLLSTVYFDVGHYTSYEVLVSFEGKTRSYRAIAFHHDQGERAVAPKLTFWDSIGADGVLSQVLAETLPPYGNGPK